MAVIPAIVAIFTALPDILKLVQAIGPEFGNLMKALYVWIKHMSGDDPQGYVKKVGEAFSKLELAQTPDERTQAAKGIAELIRGLP